MLYQITNGTVSLGSETILSHIDFEVKGKEKIAVVGRNGVGKTTLLRLIAGELDTDRDDKQKRKSVYSSRKVTIGMLRQSNQEDFDKTIEEILLENCPDKELFSKERFTYEMEYNRIFTGFGFQKEEKKKRFSDFSGGEQTKISMIRLLLLKPDILLLDEPTNHLDMKTVEWLEEYMREYDKAVVFVSHDRFFLDQVVDVVYELQNKTLKRYVGNYTSYRQQKRKAMQIQQREYTRQQEELARLNQLVEKFKNKPKKAAFARSRKSLMERMERVPKPDTDEAHIFTGAIEPEVLGSKWVLDAEHLKIGYDRALLELSLRVRRGQKIGIIGNNGVGKSTFLKTIAGYLEPVSGKCELGNQIIMGYFDQQSASISSEKKIVEHFHDLFPSMTDKDIRQILGAYLFSGKDAAKKVDHLSGGEKSRLMLAEILTGRPNLLVLDEPTNHMDVWAKETLESAFQVYTGTILFVSHDRYFIQQVADAILVFDEQAVMYYPFGYEHYRKKSRKENGGNLTAMIHAEEQAMIADFKAVPKAERHRVREMDTDEAYLDWKFGLVTLPMEEARDRVENIWNEYESTVKEYQESMLKEDTPWKEQEKSRQIMQEAYDRLGIAWEEWTSRCMEWGEVYLEEISDNNME